MVCPLCLGSMHLTGCEVASGRQAYEYGLDGERPETITYRHQCDKCGISMDVPLLVRIGPVLKDEDE
jgi:hypothetical protein